MKHISTTLLTLFVLFFTTACSVTPKYRVAIDAISLPEATNAPTSYLLKALDEKKNAQGLRFQQYSAKLAAALHQKGYLKAISGDTPQQYIYFDYGLNQVSMERENYIEPDVSFHVGWGYPYGGFYHPFFHPYYGGGYTTYYKTRTYYNRYVTLLGKDALNKELWRVDVSSVGESKNLKKIIPLLINAALPYIGTSTSEPVEIVIKEGEKKK